MKICILIPFYNNCSPEFTVRLAEICTFTQNNFEIKSTNRVPLPACRNILVAEGLRTDCEWFFLLDSDVIPPRDVLGRLRVTAIQKKALAITGVYNQRESPHYPTIYARNPEETYPNEYSASPVILNGPAKVDRCGLGCCLIHRSVFEKLVTGPNFSWFKFIESGGKNILEDFYFCRELEKAGIDIWADPGVRCEHR